MELSGKRTADDGIYLNEDRYDKPKEIFKLIANELSNGLTASGRGQELLDVGCATGELIYHIKSLYPELHCSGVDVSPAMVAVAGEKLPDCTFAIDSILAGNFFSGKKFDAVVCSGVVLIFDDIRKPLENLVRAAKSGGRIYVFTAVNDRPIDLITRYRAAGDAGDWELGWNIFSKATYEQTIKDIVPGAKVSMLDFVMPFDIPEQADPMRTWTVDINGRKTLINGANLIVTQKLIRVTLP